MNKRLAFLIDTRYCNDCKTCEIACKMERRLDTGLRWREVRKFERQDLTPGARQHTVIHIPMSCNHCEKPECVTACPVYAYTKTPQGPVIHKFDYCIGCTQCVSACPYSAPVFNEKVGKTGKCDMCYDRLQEGMEPYCVQCCPNEALKIGYYEDLVAAYGENQDLWAVGDYSVVPSGDTTNPSIVIKLW